MRFSTGVQALAEQRIRMGFRRAAIVVISALVAAAGLLAAHPGAAEAAGGGYVKKCGGGRIFLNETERESFALHNEIRRDHNLPVFCVHPVLQRAARAHSRDMIQRDYFSHDTKGGGDFEQRVKGFGYTPQRYSYYKTGENIAFGSGSAGTPQSIMRSWMHSDGHRHNILDGDFREIGIGTFTGSLQGYDGVTMYTADFGVRR
jgi:uncharacterized protein YkwD